MSGFPQKVTTEFSWWFFLEVLYFSHSLIIGTKQTQFIEGEVSVGSWTLEDSVHCLQEEHGVRVLWEKAAHIVVARKQHEGRT